MTENIVTLPDALWAIANERATQSGCANVGEYLTRLIDQDRLAHVRKEFEDSLVEALESGPITEMTSDDWRRIQEEVERRLTTNTSS